MEQKPGQESLFTPRQSLGQHFLRSHGALANVIEAAELKKTDLVLEIGPGEGVLTRELAKRVHQVITVEKDPRLIPILRENLREFDNTKIVEGDILKLVSRIEYLVSSIKNTKDKILNTRYKVVANLPYYAATHLIRCFLELRNPPRLMVVMVQKEVGQRICPVKPSATATGHSAKIRMNLLAISVQFYADTRIVAYVPRTAFWPRPKVDSAILRLAPRINAEKKRINAEKFFQVVKAGFSQPRKQLRNNLARGLNVPRGKIATWLIKNKINPRVRAENLNLASWLMLTRTYRYFV